ncbi:MAG: DNA recombination protein RmuC [Rikenellaceae bacterium]|nr:DNA recombination protein RmuC [Rikenellaceae bacterium]MCL2691826.1 DNA recombination protein RmuC [Rikenellaceae bacterium]
MEYTLVIVLAAAACAALSVAFNSARQIRRAERERREAEYAANETIACKTDEITRLSSELARADERCDTLVRQAQRDKEELEKLQASFRAEFRNLANEILEEKTVQFKATNREAMDMMLKPFRDNITEFRERVEKIYSEENRQRGALQHEIQSLRELNRRITEETTNLTAALRGNSKVQGDWGEMILETILESSNLVRGIHYTVQENLKDAEGANLRPDIILRLPEGKHIVIDSKVSLSAFVDYCGGVDGSTEEDTARRQRLGEHVSSVRRHVNELGSKRYQELLDSPDFVIMFVPSEPAFMAALQTDSSIWDDAYKKKVIVSSPTNLFALLKIVDDLWKRDSQSRNAIAIADEGAKMYDKFVGFVETLEGIGKGLRGASESYEKAMTQLSTGRGSLVTRAEKLQKLGVKASKALPKSVSAASLEESPEESDDEGAED